MVRCGLDHPPNKCPPRVDGHNQGSIPYRILDAVRMNEPIALAELRILIIDASWSSTRRAYARLLQAGELRADRTPGGATRCIYIGGES